MVSIPSVNQILVFKLQVEVEEVQPEIMIGILGTIVSKCRTQLLIEIVLALYKSPLTNVLFVKESMEI